ncbi:MAG TPA: histidine triad nucleotide-binding protein [Holophagaceae bacterium]|nr:histidine triad nucleotide-binding protein [Holophagaceae bacterium]
MLTLALAFLLQAAPAQAPAPAPAPEAKWHPQANHNCIFCKIVAGVAPGKKVYEDEYVYAFWDIRPRAKVHLLVIPKQHVNSLQELEQLPEATRAALLTTCVRVAKDNGILDKGFRVIANSGKDAHQSVFHLHFHVVGGEMLPEDAVRMRSGTESKS